MWDNIDLTDPLKDQDPDTYRLVYQQFSAIIHAHKYQWDEEDTKKMWYYVRVGIVET